MAVRAVSFVGSASSSPAKTRAPTSSSPGKPGVKLTVSCGAALPGAIGSVRSQIPSSQVHPGPAAPMTPGPPTMALTPVAACDPMLEISTANCAGRSTTIGDVRTRMPTERSTPDAVTAADVKVRVAGAASVGFEARASSTATAADDFSRLSRPSRAIASNRVALTTYPEADAGSAGVDSSSSVPRPLLATCAPNQIATLHLVTSDLVVHIGPSAAPTVNRTSIDVVLSPAYDPALIAGELISRSAPPRRTKDRPPGSSVSTRFGSSGIAAVTSRAESQPSMPSQRSRSRIQVSLSSKDVR